MRTFANLDEFRGAEGEQLGVSSWLNVTQDQINGFADVTGDHQWIHTDPERAASGPFGGTIAHGYLTLALIPSLVAQTFRINGVKFAVNYGLNKVRFPSPLACGSRIRGTAELIQVTEHSAGVQGVVRVTVDAEGRDRPVCIAETVVLYIGPAEKDQKEGQ